eukprot:TRINITY_DN8440_c0_g1_i1.p1 TRINITY_DN8440_c0_g1~~TRINITY_DN8440_c0_g1_i1.p1  ORF type:complete len:325 (-),score=103.08 TRINITY_DN8440_c0_g1_i1:123-1040(-)
MGKSKNKRNNNNNEHNPNVHHESTVEGSGAPKAPVWIPLEGNPEVLSILSKDLSGYEDWGFSDCLGLDYELLTMCPQPCLAVLLVFSTRALDEGISAMKKIEEGGPSSSKNETEIAEKPVDESEGEKQISEKQEEQTEEVSIEKAKAEEPSEKIAEEIKLKEEEKVSEKFKDLYFMRQMVGGACGTIAIIHSLINNRDPFLPLKEGTILHQLQVSTQHLSPTERGESLANFEELFHIHQNAASTGQTKRPKAKSKPKKTGFHFVCFVHHEGFVFELDGRKSQPVQHIPTTTDMFLFRAAGGIKKK